MNADWSDQITLGSVPLEEGQTYTSCRTLCKESYSAFQYYHKFINYNSCDCLTLKPGKVLTMKAHGAYTSGYADSCGKSFVVFQI